MDSLVNVRLYSYKSFRHYGGREITTIPYICSAILIEEQRDHTFYVELTEDCALFKKGHRIAVLPKDYNV